MKAIRVSEPGSPEVMRLEEVPDLRPGPRQVLLRIKAAGVNPADTYMRAGLYRKVEVPYTPGLDAAGIVEAVGEGVTSVTPGSRVYAAGSATGTYAEQALCDEAQVHPLPERLTFAQGAGVGIPYSTAYRALFLRAQARAGEIVLVHGASGGVGVASVQMARAAGLKVIGTAGTERGRALVLEQGAQAALDHTLPNHLDGIAGLTNSRGVDVVVEMLANVNLGSDLKVLAPGGRVVIVGSRGRAEIDPRDLMGRGAAILGMMILGMASSDLAGIHAAVVAGLESGVLHPVIRTEIPLAEAPRAHREVLEPGAFGKIVLLP